VWAAFVFTQVELLFAHTERHEACCFANTYAVVLDLPIAMVTKPDTFLCPGDHKQPLRQAIELMELHGETCQVWVNALVDVITIS
jgi:hypothetical protein